MSEKKLLPLGSQTFSEFLEKNYYYVDKTAYIERLYTTTGKFKFLSRPRRFGKSLLVSTMESLFLGHKELFEGLAIYDTWDWTKTFPVLTIDFSGSDVKSRAEATDLLRGVIVGLARQSKVTLSNPDNYRLSLEEIFVHNYEKSGKKVVVLVDEYDDPISTNRANTELALELRDIMRGFYKNFKRLDKYIEFGFLTGVTKFSHLNLFSGLNNLEDITLNPDYAAICGYTEEEILDVFAHELVTIPIESLRKWYNGYSWDGKTRVYNPIDSLSAFNHQVCKVYWSKTGATISISHLLENDPGFLQALLDNFSGRSFGENIIESVDIEYPDIYSLLFQSGYLTIDSISDYENGAQLYHLRVPNLEVECTISGLVLRYLTKLPQAVGLPFYIIDALKINDFESFITNLTALYSGIPHDAYRNNNIYTYEAFYAITFIFLMRTFVGKDVYPEDASATGQADLTVLYNNSYYIFEFKVVDDKPKKEALQQIIDKNYAAKYRADGKPIYLIGIEFSKKTRTVVWHDVQQDEDKS